MTSYLEILLSITFPCFVFLCYNNKWVYKILTKNGIKTKMAWNFPIVGMLPTLLKNAHRIYEFGTDILTENGGTVTFVGPWFANMDMLVTTDPANVNYILSKHFSNFLKGPKSKILLSILGNGIVNSDSEEWEKQRRMTMSLVHQHEFRKLVLETNYNKVKNGLVSILESFANSGMEVDLQDIFHRLTFDITCKIILGYDSGSLAVDLPYCALEKAISDVEEAIFFRHVIPEFAWKLQRWFKIGKENKHMKGQVALDLFIARCILSKRETLDARTSQMEKNKENDYDLLTNYLELCDDDLQARDSVMNLFLAGTHTTSATLTWFFWLLSKNSSVEKKILEEIIQVLNPKKLENEVLSLTMSNIEEATMKMVYLHGAICEALRLYPTVPTGLKYSREKDVLPSGHIIEANSKVLLFFYAMGRMESIWGKDCLEFKPERWITEQGAIKHEPSSKFTAFNSGPRACIGKNMALVQMKIAAILVVYNFSIQVVEGHPVSPFNSNILQMKDGLKVRIRKRHM